MPRNSTAIASAYDRTRVANTQFVRGESRVYRAEFKGVIPVGATVTAATWRCDGSDVVAMANATYDATGTQVTLTAGYWGWARLKAQVTLSDGQVLEQPIAFQSIGSSILADTPIAGPTFLQATLAA